MPFGDSFAQAVLSLDSPVLQGTLAAFGTFILEDVTSITCGLLVADGRMSPIGAYLGVSVGITLGDLGLYLIGRLLGGRLIAWGWVPPDKLGRAKTWFDRNLVGAIVFSRFVPGMRVPAYAGAGIFAAHPWRFLITAICASLVWTALLMGLTIELGERVLPILGELRLPLALTAIALLAAWQITAGRKRKREAGRVAEQAPVVSLFEFWPPWLFYFPVAVKYVLLGIRYRSLMLPMNTNPSIHTSGVVCESKSEILSLVPESHSHLIAPWIVLERPSGGVTAVFLDAVENRLAESGIAWPLVAKPDIGERGKGVRPLRNRRQLRWYLRRYPENTPLILQELVPWKDEAGVLYYRLAGEENACVSSITLKSFPSVIGDGKATLRELILRDERARRISHIYLKRHRRRLDCVIPARREFPLVFAGNHCQGTVFENGTPHVTSEIVEAFDRIACAMPEFHYGRFDVRFRDLEAFKKGRDFRIIEINGAAGEATHIWDARTQLLDAWRDLFHHLTVLFEIGHENRERGIHPVTGRAFLRELINWRRSVRNYPSTL